MMDERPIIMHRVGSKQARGTAAAPESLVSPGLEYVGDSAKQVQQQPPARHWPSGASADGFHEPLEVKKGGVQRGGIQWPAHIAAPDIPELPSAAAVAPPPRAVPASLDAAGAEVWRSVVIPDLGSAPSNRGASGAAPRVAAPVEVVVPHGAGRRVRAATPPDDGGGIRMLSGAIDVDPGGGTGEGIRFLGGSDSGGDARFRGGGGVPAFEDSTDFARQRAGPRAGLGGGPMLSMAGHCDDDEDVHAGGIRMLSGSGAAPARGRGGGRGGGAGPRAAVVADDDGPPQLLLGFDGSGGSGVLDDASRFNADGTEQDGGEELRGQLRLAVGDGAGGGVGRARCV